MRGSHFYCKCNSNKTLLIDSNFLRSSTGFCLFCYCCCMFLVSESKCRASCFVFCALRFCLLTTSFPWRQLLYRMPFCLETIDGIHHIYICIINGITWSIFKHLCWQQEVAKKKFFKSRQIPNFCILCMRLCSSQFDGGFLGDRKGNVYNKVYLNW